MKKLIKFSKGFLPCTILSAVIIISGIVAIFTRGINFGLDFKPGMLEEVRIAPTVMELTYNGTATVSVDPSADGFDVVISGIGAENKTQRFLYVQNKTVSDLAAKLQAIDGITANVTKDIAIPDSGLFVNSAVSTKLSPEPFRVHASDGSLNVSADEVRSAIKDIAGASVKELGTANNKSYQIRLGVATDENGKVVQSSADEKLAASFGNDNIVVISSNFIGSQFSKSLIRDSILLVLATLVLIWLYATIRFHWDFALASVLAVIHDAFIMVTFITWSQMEFSTTTLAAILTIIGYSINATVVILDRVRSDMKTLEVRSFKEILDEALTATLSRSLITTITTLFSVLALFFFTTGEIHDFALALTVGLVSGCYSSIFISSAFIALVRRHWTPSASNAVKPKAAQMEPQA
jgi:preprotein translocase subunit SecF